MQITQKLNLIGNRNIVLSDLIMTHHAKKLNATVQLKKKNAVRKSITKTSQGDIWHGSAKINPLPNTCWQGQMLLFSFKSIK